MAWRGFLGLVLAASCGLLSGCAKPAQSAPKATPPATVPQVAKEDKLNEITLTAEAEGRIGLQTAAVEERAVRRHRDLPGEVVLPASAIQAVSSPVNGILQAAEGHDLPHDGAAVQKDQPLFTLVPRAMTESEQVSLKSAELQLWQAKIDADGQVQQALVTLEKTKLDLDRAEGLVKSKSVPIKERDDAEALHKLAQKALAVAEGKKKFVDGLSLDDKGLVKPLVIRAPCSGILRATFAAAGELIPAGKVLFEIMDPSTVWIKVPIYVGELANIAERDPVRVKNLSDPPAAKGAEAKSVQAPPTAQPQAAAVDYYYELRNADGNYYRPGQRVSVLVPLRGEEKSLGVPWSAILHDIHGGTWVYVQTGEHKYARQRAQVEYVVGDWAVLRQGPKAGTKVVTAGAAEVFGAEFNIFK